MSKISTKFIILFLIFMFVPCVLNAEEYDAIINGDAVRIRSGAGTENKALVTVNTGTRIKVIDKTLYSGTGCTKKWNKVIYGDKTGYVCSQYVSYVNTQYKGMNVIDWTSRVSGNNVSVRKDATTSSTALDSLSLGVNVDILKTVNGSSSGCSGGKWHKIQYYGDKTGYICSSYVITKSNIIATDSEYEKTLKEEGFPDSYIPYLVYLHKKHPSWQFKAGKTGLSFSEVVDAETGKCYMQTKNNNYRTSTTPAEGSSWFKVNGEVVSFYIDPRNWLYDQRMFMFEKLDYTSSLKDKYPSLVKSVFGSNKLSEDKYINAMIKAGETNKISPVTIATRIKQEVTADGSASTDGREFTWKGQKYKGFYNFFNIGAYEVKIDGVNYSAVTRGLAYAAKLVERSGKPWNNIDTAISEGSAFLANGYINKGQGTIYYQKFNVGPNAYYNHYTHQYMTNIQAPATEGASARSSYINNNALETGFVFEIPVFENMPAYTSLPNSGDPNNDLSSLSITDYALTPGFDEDILSYEAFVPKTTSKVTINATAKSSKATITGCGEHELKSDENDITITVKPEVGSEKQYKITIRKVENNTSNKDIIEKSTLSIKDNYVKNIKENTTGDKIKNDLIKNGASAVTILDSSNHEINSTKKLATGYKIRIKSAIDEKTYTIVVKGDTSGDGEITILDLLQVQKSIKKENKLTDARGMAGDTSGDGEITILDLLQIQKHIKKEKIL